MTTAYDQFLKNLSAVTEYRIKSAQAASALSQSYAQGSSNPLYAPDARQLAFEAMGNHLPDGKAVAITKDNTSILKKILEFPKHFNIMDYGPRVAETGPGKTVINTLHRTTSASAGGVSAIVDAAQGQEPLPNRPTGSIEAFLKGVAKGFVQNDQDYSKVIENINPDAGNKTKGIGGFVGDVLLDPLSFIPVGKLGKAAQLSKTAEKAAITEAPVAAVKAAKAAPSTGGLGNAMPEAAIRYSQATKIKPLQDAMTGISVAKYPVGALDTIQPPFKTATMVRTVREPIKQKTTDVNLGIMRAIKASILNTPSYKVGGKTIEEYIRAVREGTIPADAFDKNLNKYVAHILKTKQHSLIPKEFTLTNAAGNMPVGKATFKPLADLFASGKIPETLSSYSKGTDEFTHQFAVHDIGDLGGFHLTNSKGQIVSLAQHLENLGLTPNKYSKNTFEPIKTFDPGTPKSARYKGTTETFTKTSKLDLPGLRKWVTDYAGTLSSSEARYLAGAKSPAIYKKRLQQIAARTITRDFTNIDEFVAAAKSGLIPKESIDKMLSLAGAKSIDELAAKVKNLVIQGIKTPRLDKITKAEKAKMEHNKGPILDPRWDIQRIVEEVTTGDMASIKRGLPLVRPKNIADLSSVLPRNIVDNLVTPQLKEKYPFVTKIKGAKRTHATPGIGRARNLHGWGTLPQYETWKGLINRAVADFRGQLNGVTTKGEKRALYAKRNELIAKRVLDNMRLSEQALRQGGVKLIAGNDNSGIMLSMMDVIDSMTPDKVLKILFGPQKTQVGPGYLLDAAAVLAKAAMGTGSADMAKIEAVRTIQEAIAGEANAAEVVKALENAMPEMLNRVKANYAEHAIKIGESVTSMTDETIHNLITQFADPSVDMGKAFESLMTRHEQLAAIGHKINAPADALTAAKDLTDIKLTAVVTPGDLAEAKTASAVAKGADDAIKTTAGVKQQASRAAEAKALTEAGDTLNDLGDEFEIGLQWGIARSGVPILDKASTIMDQLGQAFVPHYGHETLHHIVHQEHNVTQSFSRTHRALMQTAHEAAQKYASITNSTVLDVTKEAWRLVQNPSLITGPLPPEMQLLVDRIQNSVELVLGGTSVRGAPAVRNGIFTDHFNRTMDYYGVPKEFRFEKGKPLINQTDVWRNWEDMPDPLDALDKMHGAFQRATIEVTIGRDLSSKWGSATKQLGSVKLVDKFNKSDILPFVDTELYYPKEIAEQLVHLDRVMKATYTNTAPLTRLLDGALHSWKAGMTIYRPGHHVRNAIGDIMFNWLGGVNDIRVYHKAIKIMSGRAKSYQQWDGLKALQDGVGVGNSSEIGKVFANIGGKKIALNDDAVWRGSFEQGLLPDFRVLEDISLNTSQNFSGVSGRSITRPFKGHVREFAGHVSMARDHYTRIAHFINELQTGKYATLEEAFAKSGATVRKWHPDGSDLTAFERKYMRRLIPFYSWMRKAIPLVVEALVMKPGKVMVVPKGAYNFAIANGIDPESFSNPFPTDQLFPSWMTQDIIGPQWQGGLAGLPGTGGNEPGRYHGSNPGDPVSDLLSGILGKNPLGEIAGSVNPLVKDPFELASGHYAGTGAAIKSTPEYIDQQIPGISVLSNVLNRSIAGGGQEQLAVQNGAQPSGIDVMALLNQIHGLGIRDYSDPRYIKSAENELKRKIGQKLKDQQNGQ